MKDVMNLMQLWAHLWQSTVFAGLVGLGTLAFRRHEAAVRHAMWVAASFKFLVPFGALIAFGGSLGIRTAAIAAIQRQVTIVIRDPGAGLSLPPIDAALAEQTKGASAWSGWIGAAAIALWAGGTLLILGVWVVRWRRIAALARSAPRIEDGSTVAALRRLESVESVSGRKRRIGFVSCDAQLEPGVFGVLRPVLLWPAAIADHLDTDQIEAILAHEVSHVRRRDNLWAALHMIVEAAFWFHPLVWWIGARLVDERERACDEDVLHIGGRPEVYAETILKACRMYVEAPLACVAGVTGSDLTRRIERIMTHGGAEPLSRSRKTVLGMLAFVTIAAPIGAGAVSPHQRVERAETRVTTFALRVSHPLRLQVTPDGTTAWPQFEVASVKPNQGADVKILIQTLPGGRFSATNVPIRLLIQYAYGLQPPQLAGGPGWIDTDHFDIVAKGDADEDVRLMLRSLLADRFNLGTHIDSRELPVYALVVAAKDGHLGPQLARAAVDCDAGDAAGKLRARNAKMAVKPSGEKGCGIHMGAGSMAVNGASLSQVANSLTNWAGRIVMDRTGLSGDYDFTLKWTPDRMPQGFDKKFAAGALAAPDPNGPSLFTAVREQLGLKLDPQKAPVDVLVIDRAERPTGN
ncbi:MAG TPA: M56 family metallopeptidase [Vicinamibacterales bacterium]|nr:M56 family metallopeptidase [Vicinamibacterales bacterium]